MLRELLEHPVTLFDPLTAAECTDLVPTECRADAVVVLSDESGPVLAVVVEVQLGRDQDKRWSWPVYLTTLRARLRRPAELLVICPDGVVRGPHRAGRVRVPGRAAGAGSEPGAGADRRRTGQPVAGAGGALSA
ncbi:MAG: hypothetical protein ACT4NY_18545 [Pseudonocardiales bacterium]